jgi:hypothetical protein
MASEKDVREKLAIAIERKRHFSELAEKNALMR